MDQIDLRALYRLRQAGILPARRFAHAARLVRDETVWTLWGQRALLALGLTQILAGTLFFFAFNWAAIPPMAKFAGLGVAVTGAAIGAWMTGIRHPAGQALLIAASVLSGVLLAVIGQVYQTGADAFQLFAAWALLIMPWVAVSRSAAHWALWAVLCQLAWSLYLAQVWLVVDQDTTTAIVVTGLSGLVSALILMLREAAMRSGLPFAVHVWTRIAPLLILCGHLVAMGLQALLEEEAPGALAAAILGLGALAGIYWRVLPSLPALALAVAALAALVAAIGWWAITRIPNMDDSPILLLMLWVGWSLAVLLALQRGLRLAAARMKMPGP